MSFPLNFDIRHRYKTLDSGIQIRAALSHGSCAAVCQAKVDTGSEVCLFQRDIGETLGIDVESGYRLELGTLTSGGLIAYGHEVTLYTLDLEFDSFVYFAEDYNLPRNILGREGWLRNVRMAVVDYDAEIYLSPYDSA